MAAFLGALLWEGDGPQSRLERILESNWTLQGDLEDALVVDTDSAGIRVALEPDEERLRKVVTKNAVGHLYLAHGIARPPSKVSMCARENLPDDAREKHFGMSSAWITTQEGTNRYQVISQGMIVVRSVIHEYLVTEALWEGIT